MRLLVTGSGGYIGSAVCRMMHELGFDVVGLDSELQIEHPWEQVQHDVRDIDAISHALRPDAVIHLAALAAVGECDARAAEYRSVNVDGTKAVVAMMRQVGCRRILFASSSSVYGNGLGLTETERPLPASLYGETKLEGETIVMQADTRPVVMRFFNVIGSAFGSGDYTTTSIVPRLFSWMKWRPDEPFPIDGTHHPTEDGTPVRDYVHLGDICRAMAILVGSNLCGTFNLGTGKATTVAGMMFAVYDVCGVPVPKHVDVGARAHDVHTQTADTRRADSLIPWRAEVRLKDSLISHKNWLDTREVPKV